MERIKLCLNASEVSNSIGLSLSEVRKLTCSGEIPHIRVGRRILYPVTEIENWLRQKTVSTTSTSKGGNDIEP